MIISVKQLFRCFIAVSFWMYVRMKESWIKTVLFQVYFTCKCHIRNSFFQYFVTIAAAVVAVYLGRTSPK